MGVLDPSFEAGTSPDGTSPEGVSGDGSSLDACSPDGCAKDAPPPSTKSGLQPKVTEPVSAPVPTGDPATRADVFGLTDRGRVRPTNQDQFLIAELRRSLLVTQGSVRAHEGRRVEAPQARLLVVADGMGGYEGGGLASSVAVDSFAQFVLTIVPWFVATGSELRDQLAQTLQVGVRGADEDVHRTALELDLDERMGTTLTAAYVAWPEAYLVHVGDSRAYLFREGQLIRLTVDHTVAQELLTAHALDAGQAARSQLRHVLVNTVGGLREKRLKVDLRVVELREGDTLLLCTDGVAAHLRDEELPELVVNATSAEDAARNVFDIVEARGAVDNVTVVVARF